jgi:transcription elongation factor Elf1
MANRNAFGSMFDSAPRREFAVRRSMALHLTESVQDECGKCGAEIDSSRRIDFTLKDGTRVCDSCFVKGTIRPTQTSDSMDA